MIVLQEHTSTPKLVNVNVSRIALVRNLDPSGMATHIVVVVAPTDNAMMVISSMKTVNVSA